MSNGKPRGPMDGLPGFDKKKSLAGQAGQTLAIGILATIG
jgi:hypothetical protein